MELGTWIFLGILAFFLIKYGGANVFKNNGGGGSGGKSSSSESKDN
mgnify:CR=1 FL=1